LNNCEGEEQPFIDLLRAAIAEATSPDAGIGRQADD
jgi:hypothetical protein